MDTNEIVIDTQKTFGDFLVVDEPRAVYKYVDNKPTDELDAYLYRVLSTKTWQQYGVKVKETIPTLKYNGEPMPVLFTNLNAKLWQDFKTKEVKISLTADSVQVVQTQSKLKMNREVKNNEV